MGISKALAKKAASDFIKENPHIVPDCYRFSELIKDNYNNDWILPFLHSETWHTKIGLEEGSALRHICGMIEQGDVWLRFINMPKWAQPNSEMDENAKILSTSTSLDVRLQNSPQDSDGYVTLTEETTFHRLFIDSEATPEEEEIPYIQVQAGTTFPIEIGTNSVLKTWGYFFFDGKFAALPYNAPLISKEPKLALFYITNRKSIFD